jgi:hypothetical protein
MTSALMLGVVACSGIQVSTDYDDDVYFGQYKTFDFYLVPHNLDGHKRLSAEYDRAIKKVASEELASAGIAQKGHLPDMYLAYRSLGQHEERLDEWGYGQAREHKGRGDKGLDADFYPKGTLVIDLIDRDTNEIIWRGTADAPIDETSTIERIEQAVVSILREFPPR